MLRTVVPMAIPLKRCLDQHRPVRIPYPEIGLDIAQPTIFANK